MSFPLSHHLRTVRYAAVQFIFQYVLLDSGAVYPVLIDSNFESSSEIRS